jgi:signal transduction histidine kinase/ligand-binding sensor domain-containing protein
MASRAIPCRTTFIGRFGLRLQLALAILLAITAGVAHAAGAETDHAFARFKHDRWTADDGAPTGIRAIAQTPDGYLWLASVQGLFRFDGVLFERIAAPRMSDMEFASPSALLVTHRGELWVGYFQSGGVARFRGGRLRDMRMPRPPNQVSTMAEGGDGSIWVGASDWTDRLKHYANGGWEQVDGKIGLPPGSLGNLFAARDGTLWLPVTLRDNARSSVLALLSPGSKAFRLLPLRFGRWPSVGDDPAGRLWISDAQATLGLRLKRGDAVTPMARIPAVPGLRYPTLAFDRTGGIWGSTSAVGIFYIPQPSMAGAVVPFRFTATDGLTSNVASAAFADREGSVWIGTALGLDRFRPANVRREPSIPLDQVAGQAIAASGDGDVYIATLGTIFRATAHRAPRPVIGTRDKATALCPALRGGVWAAAPSGISRITEAAKETVPPPPGGLTVMSCAEDGGAHLWVALMNGRLAWHDQAGWHDLIGEPSIEEITATPMGNVAFRTASGEIGFLRNGRIVWRGTPRPSLRSISMLAPGAQAVYASGSNALLRLNGTGMRQLDGRIYPWLTALRGLAQTPDGVTWTLGRDGISRMATADLDHAFTHPGAPIPRRLFDSRDGSITTPQQAFYPGAQVAAGRDGRIWFLDRAGAVFVDPARITRNDVAPSVIIRSLAAGGLLYHEPGRVVLPRGTHSIDIAYTATSLSVPQRVRFRYRLDGIDDDWVDAGGRRTASYANLGPGTYRFQVIAANEDGVWNRIGAVLTIEIKPTFVQSWPFRVLCLLTLAVLLWLFYRLRVRAIAEGIRARMAERMDERERIARELHDTLLQSVQALTLRFQLALDDLPPEEPARHGLEQAIDRADQVIAEGRDRVRDLRSRQDGNLDQIVRDLLTRQVSGSQIKSSVVVTGAPHALAPTILDEIAAIVGEAIFNVVHHAYAAHLTVEIGYGDPLAVRIVDDGIGIAPEYAEGGGPDGHFGLIGMRERANGLHGTLVVRRLDARGTEVVLSVPATFAYRSARTGFTRVGRLPWRRV